jgi:sucrose-6-phosphate hydrolase SacC (GH32 family)
MKKWTRLPVALWNDQPYDNVGIWSGSITIVDGEIILVYPGLCDKQKACENEGGNWTPPGKCDIITQCVTGRNIATAKPADPTDPFLTNWTKNGPIINASDGCLGHCNVSAPGDRGKDPSSAWKTPSGEWRMVTGGSPYVYGSMDFQEWYFLGLGFTTAGVPQGNGGDCPSFFPLPANTPGAGPAPNASAPVPTHAHLVFGGELTMGW